MQRLNQVNRHFPSNTSYNGGSIGPKRDDDVVIIGKGNNIKHYLNDRLILDFTDNEPNLALNEGIVALQLHAGKPMWVEFKNIRLFQSNH